MVSAAPGGAPGNGYSEDPAQSRDGRFVVFVSAASNLAAADEDSLPDLFVRDLANGTTTAVSVGPEGRTLGAVAGAHALSADGRMVAFAAQRRNLVTGEELLRPEIFVRDMDAGRTVWAQVGMAGASAWPHLSGDGRTLHFVRCSPGARAAEDTFAIYRFDVATGTAALVASPAMARAEAAFHYSPDIAVDESGGRVVFVDGPNLLAAAGGVMSVVDARADGARSTGKSFTPIFGAAGRHLIFATSADDAEPAAASAALRLLARNMETGETKVVAQDAADSANLIASPPAISPDGNMVAFVSARGDLATGDANGRSDVFIWSRADSQTRLASARKEPAQPVKQEATHARAITGDGKFIVYSTLDENRRAGLYVLNREQGIARLASSMLGTGEKTTNVFESARISPDGRYVAYATTASNITSILDTNRTRDLFLFDSESKNVRTLTARYDGTRTAFPIANPEMIRMRNDALLFRAIGRDLVDGPYTAGWNLHVHDLNEARTYRTAINSDLPRWFDLGPGPTIAVISGPTTGGLFLHNYRTSTSTTLLEAAATPRAAAVTADGRKVFAACATADFALYECRSDGTQSTSISTGVYYVAPDFTGDRLALVTPGGLGRTNLVWWDRVTRTRVTVAERVHVDDWRKGGAKGLAITADGMRIFYTKRAWPGATKQFQFFVFDAETRQSWPVPGEGILGHPEPALESGELFFTGMDAPDARGSDGFPGAYLLSMATPVSFGFGNVERRGSRIAFAIETLPGLVYSIERAQSLAAAPADWQTVGETNALSATTSFEVDGSAGDGFFRARILP